MFLSVVVVCLFSEVRVCFQSRQMMADDGHILLAINLPELGAEIWQDLVFSDN